MMIYHVRFTTRLRQGFVAASCRLGRFAGACWRVGDARGGGATVFAALTERRYRAQGLATLIERRYRGAAAGLRLTESPLQEVKFGQVWSRSVKPGQTWSNPVKPSQTTFFLAGGVGRHICREAKRALRRR
jgi:hypothetical protein